MCLKASYQIRAARLTSFHICKFNIAKFGPDESAIVLHFHSINSATNAKMFLHIRQGSPCLCPLDRKPFSSSKVRMTLFPLSNVLSKYCHLFFTLCISFQEIIPSHLKPHSEFNLGFIGSNLISNRF